VTAVGGNYSNTYAWGIGQPASEEPPRYTNSANVAASQWDITVDFLLSSQAPGSTTEKPLVQQHRVVQVVMSPMHAKALAALLSGTLDNWEHKFGPLPSVDLLLPDLQRQLSQSPSTVTAVPSPAEPEGGDDA
jgi:Protein of unknown function (DUF3467)